MFTSSRVYLSFCNGSTVVDYFLTRLAKKYGESVVVVKKVSIYKTPLHNLRKTATEETATATATATEETMVRQGATVAASTNWMEIHHLFLMVEVQPVWGDQSQGLKIRAEKCGPNPDGTGFTGVTVNHAPFIEDADKVEYSVDVDGVAIRFGDLMSILTKHNPDYSLLSDNCWKYAETTYRDLVETLERGVDQGNHNDHQNDHMNIFAGGNNRVLLATNLREMPPLFMPIDGVKQVAIVVGVGALTWVVKSALQRVMSRIFNRDNREGQVPATSARPLAYQSTYAKS